MCDSTTSYAKKNNFHLLSLWFAVLIASILFDVHANEKETLTFESHCVTNEPKTKEKKEFCSSIEKCHPVSKGRYFLESSISIKCVHCGGKKKRKQKLCSYTFANRKQFEQKLHPTEICIIAHAESTYDSAPLAGWTKCEYTVRVKQLN